MKSEYFNKNDKLGKIIFFYAILTFMCFVSLYPLLNILSVALRPGNLLFSTSLKLIPDNATLENFRIILFERDFITWLKNSLVVSAVATVITVLLSVTAAYAFSRYKFKGKGVLLTSFLITQISLDN